MSRAGIARTLLYGVVASLVTFSVSVAIQRTFFGPAPETNETARASSSAGESSSAGLLRSVPGAGSYEAASYDVEDAGSEDLAAGGKRVPVTRRGTAAALDQSVTTSSGDPGEAQPAPDPPHTPWWSPVARLLSSGEEGRASAPGSTVPNAVSPPSAPNPAQAAGAAQAATVQFIGMGYDGTPMQRADFSVHALRDLRIRVSWDAPGPGHVQRLNLHAPTGDLYQRVVTGIDAAQAGLTVVETLLPVAGTWITQHSLLGAWAVEVYLDDATTPVTTAAFVIDS
jgi:hypothetical protein